MKNKEKLKQQLTVSAAIYTIFGEIPSQKLVNLSKAMQSLEHCNMHYGLNAQVSANIEFSAQVSAVIRDLSDHQLQGLCKSLAVASDQICCDEYPACKEG